MQPSNPRLPAINPRKVIAEFGKSENREAHSRPAPIPFTDQTISEELQRNQRPHLAYPTETGLRRRRKAGSRRELSLLLYESE